MNIVEERVRSGATFDIAAIYKVTYPRALAAISFTGKDYPESYTFLTPRRPSPLLHIARTSGGPW
jgi:hypothetical protein